MIAHVYGFARAKGYAYCVGANMITLNSKLYVDNVASSFYSEGVMACITDDLKFNVKTNYPITKVTWDFELPELAYGEEVVQRFPTGGDYDVKAYIEGVALNDQHPVFDTLSVVVHMGEPTYQYDEMIVCDLDSVEYHGMNYFRSGEYWVEGHSIYGCDSSYYLTLDMDFTPYFAIQGTHWPIGGSETHISINEYAIRLSDSRAQIDTVLWQIDCPNWYVVPHGEKGKECTLNIFSYLLEPVVLHAWAVNRCDTVHEEFFIQTSYYEVEEHTQDAGFTISPNPTDGRVTLCFGHVERRTEVQVFNGQGQEVDAFIVESSQGQEMSYLMPDVPDGMYFIVVKTDEKTWIQKLFLKR